MCQPPKKDIEKKIKQNAYKDIIASKHKKIKEFTNIYDET